MPIFHLLAGPNGAGKSTLYRALLAEGLIDSEMEFINADIYEREHLKHIKNPLKRTEAARSWAEGKRNALMLAKHSFVSETVFSHTSKIDLIQQAKQAGYQIVLYIVALDHPALLVERVKQRVREGGHDVPTAKILSRYPRTLALLAKAVQQVDAAFLYDSQDIQRSGLEHIATIRKGALIECSTDVPVWVKTVLNFS